MWVWPLNASARITRLPVEMTRVFVAAGGNIDPARRLPQALAGMRAAFGELSVSLCYANAAFGFEGDDFHNLVVAFDTALPLAEVLAQLEGEVGQGHGKASAGAANDANEAARLKVEGHTVNGQCVVKAFAEIAK